MCCPRFLQILATQRLPKGGKRTRSEFGGSEFTAVDLQAPESWLVNAGKA